MRQGTVANEITNTVPLLDSYLAHRNYDSEKRISQRVTLNFSQIVTLHRKDITVYEKNDH